jgi:hypothetical protein
MRSRPPAASGDEGAMPLYAAAERKVTSTLRAVLAPAIAAAHAAADGQPDKDVPGEGTG